MVSAAVIHVWIISFIIIIIIIMDYIDYYSFTDPGGWKAELT